MGRNLPAHVQAKQPARVIHYVDPVPGRSEVILRTEAEVKAFRAQQSRLVARSRARQQAIAERDRKVRRFWFGFGAVIGLAVLITLTLVGVLIWHYLAGIGAGVLAVPAILLMLSGLAVGGHRCITIVQHMH